jgi:hypothetical protein
VDADVSEDRLAERFHGILKMLRPETPPFGDFVKAGRDARGELAAALQALPAGKPVLFVVDCVPEPSQVNRPSLQLH